MTSQHPLDALEKLWKRKERTDEQMLGQFLIHLKDHEQMFVQGEEWLDEARSKFEGLEERLDALEAWRATAGEQLSEIKAQLGSNFILILMS